MKRQFNIKSLCRKEKVVMSVWDENKQDRHPSLQIPDNSVTARNCSSYHLNCIEIICVLKCL